MQFSLGASVGLKNGDELRGCVVGVGDWLGGDEL